MSNDEIGPPQADTWGAGFVAGMRTEQGIAERKREPITLDEMLMSRQVLRIVAETLGCQPKDAVEAVRALKRDRDVFRARAARLEREHGG